MAQPQAPKFRSLVGPLPIRSLHSIPPKTFQNAWAQVVSVERDDIPHRPVYIVRAWCPGEKPKNTTNNRIGEVNAAVAAVEADIEEASRGFTFDIFCYDYPRHTMDSILPIKSKSWVVFRNIRITTISARIQYYYAMHENGDDYGRAIIVLPDDDAEVAAWPAEMRMQHAVSVRRCAHSARMIEERQRVAEEKRARETAAALAQEQELARAQQAREAAEALAREEHVGGGEAVEAPAREETAGDGEAFDPPAFLHDEPAAIGGIVKAEVDAKSTRSLKRRRSQQIDGDVPSTSAEARAAIAAGERATGTQKPSLMAVVMVNIERLRANEVLSKPWWRSAVRLSKLEYREEKPCDLIGEIVSIFRVNDKYVLRVCDCDGVAAPPANVRLFSVGEALDSETVECISPPLANLAGKSAGEALDIVLIDYDIQNHDSKLESGACVRMVNVQMKMSGAGEARLELKKHSTDGWKRAIVLISEDDLVEQEIFAVTRDTSAAVRAQRRRARRQAEIPVIQLD